MIKRHCLHCFNCIIFRRLTLQRCFASSDEFVRDERRTKCEEPPSGKALKIAVIGCPNVGKSALTNMLIKAQVCAVSRQVDTTRENTITALTEDNCQLVVVDSPGLIGTRHAKKFIGTNTDARILSDPERAIKHSGHLLVVQDATANGEYIQHRVLHLLHRYSHIPATLVLNKIDLIPHRSYLLRLADILTEGLVDGVPINRKQAGFGLLDSIQTREKRPITVREDGFPIHVTSSIRNRDEKWQTLYTQLLQRPAHKCSWTETRKLYLGQNGWPQFKSVFFVSCVTGEGVNALRDYLRELSEPADNLRYQPDTVSTKHPRSICLEHVRSEFLDRLQGYVAYSLNIRIVDWDIDVFTDSENPLLRIILGVNCEKERVTRVVHSCVTEVEEAVTQRLKHLFKMPVALRIYLKTRGQMYVAPSPPVDDEKPKKNGELETDAKNAGPKKLAWR